MTTVWCCCCALACAKEASERFLWQHDRLRWFERELVQRYICGPKKLLPGSCHALYHTANTTGAVWQQTHGQLMMLGIQNMRLTLLTKNWQNVETSFAHSSSPWTVLCLLWSSLSAVRQVALTFSNTLLSSDLMRLACDLRMLLYAVE